MEQLGRKNYAGYRNEVSSSKFAPARAIFISSRINGVYKETNTKPPENVERCRFNKNEIFLNQLYGKWLITSPLC